MSIFSNKWKGAIVRPIPKITNSRQAIDFWPVSLMCILSKMLGVLMREQILAHFWTTGLQLYSLQTGFRSHHSITTAVLRTCEDIRRRIRQSKHLTLLDFSKAFDCLDHLLLCKKLATHFRFARTAIRLVAPYLIDRRLRVSFRNPISAEFSAHSGVPQVSVLGPLLFSLFELPAVVKHLTAYLYADDVALLTCSPISEPWLATGKLNADLEDVCEWSRANHLQLNATKIQILPTYKRDLDIGGLGSVHIINQIISFSTKIKYLGLTVDSTLYWDQHVNAVSAKVFF